MGIPCRFRRHNFPNCLQEEISSTASQISKGSASSPVSIPQNAAASVMRLLQIDMMPTGPQDDAKTVAMKVVSQKICGGKMRPRPSTTAPAASIMMRLKRSVLSWSELS